MNELERLDPSPRSVEQLQREIAALKELLFTRLDAMEKAVGVAHDDLVRVPTSVDKAIGQLKDVVLEKFTGIETQFKERDQRVEQIAALTSRAVDAALSAQKEQYKQQTDSFAASIAKSEGQFTKLIDQLSVLSVQQNNALNEKIDDVRARLTTMEGAGKGQSALYGWIVSAIIAIGAIVAIWSRTGG